jgi:hypothetical protein
MSLNVCLAVLPHTTIDEIGVLDATPHPFDEATLSTDLHLFGTQVGDHVALVDPMLELQALTTAERLSRQVYIVTLSDIADTYMFKAHGPVTRFLVHAEGEVVVSEGDPLPVESVFEGAEMPKDGHLAVLSALLEAPFNALWDAEFVKLTSGRS